MWTTALCALAGVPAMAEVQPAEPTLFIREYRVEGVKKLSREEIGETVYPFLGPGRTSQDVEAARAALEKAYKDKGFQSVEVQVPAQDARFGVIRVEVVEATVGRLRVHGSRYFSLAEIKRKAPSLAEGQVPNFNEITRDIVGLNTVPDRRVTPTLRPGVVPGTVDIDLNVKDTLPLHGSVELNNRFSADTTSLRVNASASYNNLWQLGHTIGASVQIAPERTDDAKVFSGFYLMRFPDLTWLNLMVLGTKQDSNVSTLGGAAVTGRGYVVGGRANITLPVGKEWNAIDGARPEYQDWKGFYHSVSLGLDYKHFDEDVLLGTSVSQAPITYVPLSANYSATWVGKGRLTEFSGGVTWAVRGIGSDLAAYDTKRFKADANFIYFRGDISHEQDLPGGVQAFGKVQGQISDQPLVNSEQFSAGGLGTVRGYLESESTGDNAVVGNFELRSPSLFARFGDKVITDWRVYGFCDGAVLSLNEPLPGQDTRTSLASYGVGSRARFFDHLNGSIDAGIPLLTLAHSQARDFLLTFRVWAEF